MKNKAIQPEELIKKSPFMHTIIDENGKFLFVNDEWRSVLGYAPKDLLGRPCFKFMYDKDKHRTLKLKNYFTKNQKLTKFVNRYVHKDGSLVHLEWEATLVKNKYYCAVRNVSSEIKNKNIEKEMQRIGKIGWWIVNVKENQVVWSDEVFRIYGLKPSKRVPVKKAIHYYVGDAKKIIADLVNNGIKNGSSWDIELPFRSADKVLKWVHTTGYPIFNDKGEVIELFGVFKDITEDKTKKDQLRFYLEKMISNSQLATLGEISAGIAHEINNPLAIIQGNAERILLSLERGKIDVSHIKQCAEKVIQTTSRISNIVSSLKTLARFDKEPFESINLKTILNEVNNMMSLKIKSNQVTFNYEMQDNKIKVRCRPVQIEQVLVNLIANSIDAIQNQRVKWIKLKVYIKSSTVHIAVVDSGKGIPKQIRAKIMEPFFTTKNVGKGTGLGLSISRRILREHGGNLFLDESQRNTTFVVELPI